MSEEKESEQEEIKIVDRRRFDESGDSRGDAEETSEGRSQGTGAEATESKKVAEESSSESTSSNASQERAASGPPPEMDFSSFVVGLATQALVMMGEVADPESRIVSKNLDAAKQTIDILCLLRDKTKGNLNPAEEKLITEIISTIQLKFVEHTNRA